jgi:hypothetical protein
MNALPSVGAVCDRPQLNSDFNFDHDKWKIAATHSLPTIGAVIQGMNELQVGEISPPQLRRGGRDIKKAPTYYLPKSFC